MNSVYEEIKALVTRWPVWYMLGSQDIKLKYRRSSLGPLWITLSMAVTIYSMGFLYGHLFKANLALYYPHLASGIIGWALVSTLLLESTNAFIVSENYIRNQNNAMSQFIMRIILRNLLIFVHNVLVFIPIIFIFDISISFKLLLIIPGLLLIAVNTMFWGSLLAVFGTRYRDFTQIVASLIQVIFFLTPIMWMPKLLPEKYRWAVHYNPFNGFLNLVRAPLMNQLIDFTSLVVVLIATSLGFILYYFVMKKFKHRIVFWL